MTAVLSGARRMVLFLQLHKAFSRILQMTASSNSPCDGSMRWIRSGQCPSRTVAAVVAACSQTFTKLLLQLQAESASSTGSIRDISSSRGDGTGSGSRWEAVGRPDHVVVQLEE